MSQESVTIRTRTHGAVTERHAEHDVDPRFVGRWSPRAFSPEHVPRATLDSMVEAARWAPSSINLQPWRFHIATSGPTRDAWNEAVGPANRVWSDNAPVLVWVVARKSMGPNAYAPPETPNRHAWFDTGSATMQFILEAERHGLRSHAMGGIDAAKAHALLGLDAQHEVICALAMGFPGDPAQLPEGYRAREQPSGRLPHAEIAKFH
ncbi:MAG: nitroreductase family protein [Thermoplasmatota archaeon]